MHQAAHLMCYTHMRLPANHPAEGSDSCQCLQHGARVQAVMISQAGNMLQPTPLECSAILDKYSAGGVSQNARRLYTAEPQCWTVCHPTTSIWCCTWHEPCWMPATGWNPDHAMHAAHTHQAGHTLPSSAATSVWATVLNVPKICMAKSMICLTTVCAARPTAPRPARQAQRGEAELFGGQGQLDVVH